MVREGLVIYMSSDTEEGPPAVSLLEEDMRELKEVIVEFLALNRYLYHKRVQKLVFAGDVRAAQITGHRLTDASFCPYKHGPYSRAVEKALEELVDDGRIDLEIVDGDKRVFRTDSDGGDLSPRKKYIVREVWKDYMGVPTDDIVEDVKTTWLYEEFEECEEIDFTEYIDEYVLPPEDQDIPREKNPISEAETLEILSR